MKDIDLLEKDITIDDASESDRFTIDSDGKADWAIRQIKAKRADAERLMKICDELIIEYDRRKDEIKRDMEKDTSYLLWQLREYFEKVPHAETKTQETYKLVSGTLVEKKPKQSIKHDDAILAQWCEETAYREYIDIVTKLRWSDLKKDIAIVDGVAIMKDGGEIVPGITIEWDEGGFEIK